MTKTTNASKIQNNSSNNSPQKQKNKKGTTSFIPQQYQDAIAVLLLGVLLIVFFRELLLGDSSFLGGVDNMAGQTLQNFMKTSDGFPLWQPYIFGGLPNFMVGFRLWDIPLVPIHYISVTLKEIFNSDLGMHIIWYISLASGMYFLMRQHKIERLISFFSAFAFVFCTGIIVWVVIGHLGKPYTFGIVPWIFVMMERIKEKVTLLNTVIMVFLMHIMLEGSHVQMIFYAACAVGIYLIGDLVHRLIRKTNWISTVKLIGVFVIATVMAALMSADKYFVLLEYTPYSIRGVAPIAERIEAQKNNKELSSKSTKSDYEYSTMWSNSPEELIDMFVPTYHGFGRVEYPGQTGKISTYWGQKPFEDATPYVGAVVLFLAFLGILRYFKHNIFIRILTITLIFAILLSFGYTFPILYDVFFYYFPKFSSFRAPIMVFILVHLTAPILAGFGLKALCDMREQYGGIKMLPKEDKIPIMLFFIAIAVFVLSGFVFSTSMETSYISSVTNSKLQGYYPAQSLSSIASFIYENTVSDWTVIGFLCVIVAVLSYLFVNKKLNISYNVFIIAVILITMIDLWRVSYRCLDFVDKQIEQQPFPTTDIINFIKEDQQKTGEYFRIGDFASQVSNTSAYFFIEDINGYHPAKLRVFQDMMDIMCGGSTSTVTHPFMWNLMNAKYLITNQQLSGGEPIFQSRQTGAFVYYNPSYCKRAFFVDSFKVEDDYSILQHLNASDFNPKTLAYLEKQINENVEPSHQYEFEMKELEQQIQQQFDSTFNLADSIQINDKVAPVAKITDYKNEYIKIETETQAQHLLVLSEMYYPIWTAYIDNKPTEIYKTNFAFRSIVVPAGKHTVEFKLISDSFKIGKKLSAGTNILMMAVLILGIILEMKKRKNK